jgi:hypothetical protein
MNLPEGISVQSSLNQIYATTQWLGYYQNYLDYVVNDILDNRSVFLNRFEDAIRKSTLIHSCYPIEDIQEDRMRDEPTLSLVPEIRIDTKEQGTVRKRKPHSHDI